MESNLLFNPGKPLKYRRIYIPGGTYFFTVVTYNRQPLFASTRAIDLLRDAFRYTMQRHPFTIVANVILPDHLHFLWTLPPETCDYSTRWRLIKSYFSRYWISMDPSPHIVSRDAKNEKYIWQRRFWEHLIENQTDLERHIDYIHFNPVKHGLVDSPLEWKYSSLSRYIDDGIHQQNSFSDREVWEGHKQME